MKAIMGQCLYLPLLCAFLVTLKLMGKLYWSWWLVLSPLWAPPAFMALFLVCGGGLLWAIMKFIGGNDSK